MKCNCCKSELVEYWVDDYFILICTNINCKKFLPMGATIYYLAYADTMEIFTKAIEDLNKVKDLIDLIDKKIVILQLIRVD